MPHVHPERLLAGLDEGQQRAVVNPHRPLAIVAPAGSGKTQVIARRVAYQAATGALDARRALCLSFTREAAGELRRRLGTLGLRELPAAGTFHAIAYALLRVFWADRRQRPAELLVDRRSYLQRLFPDVDRAELAAVDGELAWASARGLDAADYPAAARQAKRRPPGGAARVAGVLVRYAEATARARLVDFDQLLSGCIAALEGDPAFAAAQRWRFRHIFVDEFQDVNPLQFRLLLALLGDRPDLCVVGDPRQAIYGWNGADAGYLERFAEHFPGGRFEHLDHNYRSSSQVISVASAVLADGMAAPHAHRGDGPPPTVVAYADDQDEARQLAAWCRARYRAGIGWGHQAVLVRTNALARHLAGALRDAGLPVRLSLGRPAPGQAAHLAQVARTAISLAVLAADAAAAMVPDLDEADNALLAELTAEYLALDPAGTPAGLAEWIRGPGLASRASGGTIAVATFHAAKGLEWRAVHVAALEEGTVPAARATTEAARDEERRLLYVALSRATDHLTCSWTQSRQWSGRAQERTPSPYVAEVEQACARAAAIATPSPPPARYRLARPARTLPDQTLLAALLRWRARQATVVGAPAAAVLDERAVHGVAERRPTTEAELAAVPGIGPLRARRLAPTVLPVVHQWQHGR